MPGSKNKSARKKTGAKLQTKARDGYNLRVDAKTSLRMAGIRQKGTKPELVVRKLVRALGHRYRVENRDLPGSPDLANRTRRWAVFVHGCFWHRHPGCWLTTTPTRNADFWRTKFQRNVERDRDAVEALEVRGFLVVVVWECETRKVDVLLGRLRRELRSRVPD